jgi:hypothetical protein
MQGKMSCRWCSSVFKYVGPKGIKKVLIEGPRRQDLQGRLGKVGKFCDVCEGATRRLQVLRSNISLDSRLPKEQCVNLAKSHLCAVRTCPHRVVGAHVTAQDLVLLVGAKVRSVAVALAQDVVDGGPLGTSLH